MLPSSPSRHSNLISIERLALSRVLHLVNSAISHDTLHHLHESGGLQIHPLLSSLQGTMLRIANKTIHSINSLPHQPSIISNYGNTLSAIARGTCAPPRWDSAAFITDLYKALHFDLWSDSHTRVAFLGDVEPNDRSKSLWTALQQWLQKPRLCVKSIARHQSSDWHLLLARRLRVLFCE